MKYRITIEEINEVEEKCTTWRDPETNRDYTSKYLLPDDIKDRAKVSERCTGKMVRDEQEVYRQEMEDIDIKRLVTYINEEV